MLVSTGSYLLPKRTRDYESLEGFHRGVMKKSHCVNVHKSVFKNGAFFPTMKLILYLNNTCQRLSNAILNIAVFLPTSTRLPALETPRFSLSSFLSLIFLNHLQKHFTPPKNRVLECLIPFMSPLIPINNEVFMGQSLWWGWHPRFQNDLFHRHLGVIQNQHGQYPMRPQRRSFPFTVPCQLRTVQSLIHF